MVQLVEQLLPTPEVRGSNPVIGKIYNDHLFTVSFIEKTKNKEKDARNGQLLTRCACPALRSTRFATRFFLKLETLVT